MGCVALNAHVAFWTIADRISQVKVAGKNDKAFSIFTLLITGVASPILLLYLISFFIIDYIFIYICYISSLSCH